MSEWIKLNDLGGKHEVYVNMTSANSIIPLGSGSRIRFSGAEQGYIDVAEEPAIITEIIDEMRDDDRT